MVNTTCNDKLICVLACLSKFDSTVVGRYPTKPPFFSLLIFLQYSNQLWYCCLYSCGEIYHLVFVLLLLSFIYTCFKIRWGEVTLKNASTSFLYILKSICILNLERFFYMSCLGLLVHAVRRTLPVLPYVCPHTSLVPFSYWLWGAWQCARLDPWDIAGPRLPHPKGT